VLGAGCWVLGTGCWVLGVGFWVLGAGCWVLGLGCWALVMALIDGIGCVRDGSGNPFILCVGRSSPEKYLK
ncbi:MAG: hypothetical protein EOO48_13750, partial [Flavobacterium sp.]